MEFCPGVSQGTRQIREGNLDMEIDYHKKDEFGQVKYQIKILLANKEFELLLFMSQNPNIAFSKETLFNRIWGMDCTGDTDTVTVHINRLRQKLEKNSTSHRMIETVWGVGYRFKINDIQ